MPTFSVRFFVLAALGIVSFARGASIVNGGFESGIGVNADNWTNTIANPGAGAGTQVYRTDLVPHSGAFHMALEVDSDLAPGEVFATSDLFAIVPGETFTFSFWSRLDATNGPGLVAFYTIQFLDSDGSNGGGVKGQTGPTPFYGSLTDAYGQITAQITAPDASTGVDAAFLRLQFAGGAFAASDGRIYVDDVNVPEPTTAALLPLATIALLTRRRPGLG
jgi:hypothetical protein